MLLKSISSLPKLTGFVCLLILSQETEWRRPAHQQPGPGRAHAAAGEEVPLLRARKTIQTLEVEEKKEV